ncbi:MAG: DUF4399 domain-containing protein [Steroidobacteraceae bacterium]
MRRIAAAFLLLTMSAIAADLPRSPAPAGVALYFIAPEDGAKIANPVTVRFGLKGMGVAPAGIAMAGTGHHHLLIDATMPSSDRPIPADDRHVHFGKGQTETVVTLTPGRHRLQLLLGDHLHRPHDPPVISTPITITVE